MVFEVSLDLWCLVVRCFINEQNYFPEPMSFCIRYDVVQVFSEFDIPPTREAVPHYFPFRPEESDEAIHSFGIAKCGNVENVAFRRPTALNFWKQLNPLFVLKCYGDPFFKRALAARLYRRISARLR